MLGSSIPLNLKTASMWLCFVLGCWICDISDSMYTKQGPKAGMIFSHPWFIFFAPILMMQWKYFKCVLGIVVLNKQFLMNVYYYNAYTYIFSQYFSWQDTMHKYKTCFHLKKHYNLIFLRPPFHSNLATGSHLISVKHKHRQLCKLLNTDQLTIVLKKYLTYRPQQNTNQHSELKPISGSCFLLLCRAAPCYHRRKNKAG